MEKWMSMILRCVTFLVGGYFIVGYTNWTFLIGLVIFLWGNNLMVTDNYKEYFEKHSRKYL
jgi:predicted tellurium resistance membrane protein TerC